jgi:hypothetical protein
MPPRQTTPIWTVNYVLPFDCKSRFMRYNSVTEEQSKAFTSCATLEGNPLHPRETRSIVASIEEVRAQLASANDKASEVLGQLQGIGSGLEEAQAIISRTTEGSGQADVSEANTAFAAAANGINDVMNQVQAGISSNEAVMNRL